MRGEGVEIGIDNHSLSRSLAMKRKKSGFIIQRIMRAEFRCKP